MLNRKFNYMTKNKVYINSNDIVEILVNGDQTSESVQKMAEEAARLVAQLKENGRKGLIIDNLTTMGIVPPEVRKKVVEHMKMIDYDKLALYGRGGLLKIAANLLMQAIGRGSSVRFFDDYEQATDWLKDKK